MDFGIKVSKPNNNVFKAGSGDLFLDTSYPLLKIKASGSGSLSIADGNTDEDVIAHNLGYIPKVLVYGQYYDVFASGKSDSFIRYPVAQEVSTYTSSFYVDVDSANLTIGGGFFDMSGYSGTFNYFYYLFYDEF